MCRHQQDANTPDWVFYIYFFLYVKHFVWQCHHYNQQHVVKCFLTNMNQFTSKPHYIVGLGGIQVS